MNERLLPLLLAALTLLQGPTAFSAQTRKATLAQIVAKSKSAGEAELSETERLKFAKTRFESHLLPSLKSKGFTHSPKEVVLAFFKDRRVVELYAGNDDRHLELIKTYPVTAASGKPGPKLREGDRQVPEGVYRVESLNPASQYFLSLRVSYPNDDDRKQALDDGRTGLGGDIMIHGKRASIGCIALGDEAIGEIFHLASITSYSRWKLLLAPTDLRSASAPSTVLQRLPWMGNIYDDLQRELQRLPPRTGNSSAVHPVRKPKPGPTPAITPRPPERQTEPAQADPEPPPWVQTPVDPEIRSQSRENEANETQESHPDAEAEAPLGTGTPLKIHRYGG